MQGYSARVFWSEADEGYIATCPEFPGVSAFGSTPEEAVAELGVAVDLAVETYRDEGWDLPAPYAGSEHSGQFRLRLPKSLHAALAERADAEGVSLNTLAATYLARALGRAEALPGGERDDRTLLEGWERTAALETNGSPRGGITRLAAGERNPRLLRRRP